MAQDIRELFNMPRLVFYESMNGSHWIDIYKNEHPKVCYNHPYYETFKNNVLQILIFLEYVMKKIADLLLCKMTLLKNNCF